MWIVALGVALSAALGGCGDKGDKGAPKGAGIAASPHDLPARSLPTDILRDDWANEGVADRLDESARLKLHTDRVVIFKDGHALIVKKAKGKVDPSGLLFTDEVPDDAVLGTFWATSEGDDAKPLGMRAELVSSQRQRTTEVVATSIVDLLRANEGQVVTLSLREGQADIERECRVLRVLDNPGVANADRFQDLMLTAEERSGQRLTLTHEGGGFVLIGLPDNTQQVLPVSQVIGLRGESLRTTNPQHQVLRQQTKRLVFDMGADKAGQEVGLSVIYFRSGFRWVPTYRLDEATDTSVTMSLQAEVINDAETLDDAEVNLVVGVPNIRFTDMRSPLALESAMRQAYDSSGYGRSGIQAQRFDNNNFSNAAFGNNLQAQAMSAPIDDIAVANADSQQWTARFDGGGQQMDLYVYNAGRLSLGKGGRATLPLWTSAAPKQDIYGVNFNIQRSAHEAATDRARVSLNKVWRYMHLQNTSPVPWTTGPALMMREGSPIAQDLMTYTAPGRAVRLPVTVATNVIATHDDTELERSVAATHLNFHSYTRLRKRTEVTVSNNSDKPATVEVNLSAGGKADQVSDSGTANVADYNGSDWSNSPGDTSSLNSHSDVTWTVTLQPGERKTVSARFTYFVY
jgi:hypothetical protein